jgi:hypothetical protein
MAIIFLVLFALGTGDVSELGSLQFTEREAAQARLQKLGPFAVPAIKNGLKSDDPEIRHRCSQLYAPWSRELLRQRAWALIKNPYEPDPESFFEDHMLRYYVYDIIKTNHLYSYMYSLEMLLPEYDNHWMAQQGEKKWSVCVDILRKCRVDMGYAAPAPREKK